MRSKRSRLAVVGVLALALSVVVGPGVAQGAKVTETAPGGVLPDETAGPVVIQTPLIQEFNLKGKNVKKKQTLDVNVIMNSSSPDLAANSDLAAFLVGPKGDNTGIPIPFAGQNMVNVKFDDQSDLFACNPLSFQRRDCNYLQGANPGGTAGTMTGSLNATFNPVFHGRNPKGTWSLFVYDTDDAAPTFTLGTSTLEVKTGKKFAKE